MSLQTIQQAFRNRELDKWTYISRMYGEHARLFEYASFLPGTNISRIEILDDEVVMTFRDSGLRFICTRNDQRLAPFDTLNFGRYEAEELGMQKALIAGCRTVLDIGGNYGWYAMHIAAAFPAVRVLSFEPIPHTFGFLNRNLAINNLTGVETFPFGFSDSAGTFDFYYDPGLSVNASLQNLTGKESVVKLECQVKTLDEFWAGRGEKADFIKCDVEGAELLVFRGGEETLRRDKPMVFSEMLRKWTAGFGYHPNDILDFFQGLGYRCFTLSDGGLKSFGRVGEDTIETNFFFLHPEVHSGAIQNHQR